MNNYAVKNLNSERISFPDVNTLLKISLGLIMFTVISFVLVYAETIPVNVEGITYDVEYTATGMTVSAIEADLESISLILSVDVTDSSGMLDITLDRSFFDSTFEENGVLLDEEFLVLVDADFADFKEIETTSKSRTLSITLPSGTEEIEIIGYSFNLESTPVEEPAVEEPVINEPPVVEDKPVVTPPKVQCGPGTILKDGACVLDQRCGPGTVLKDGACVLDTTPQPTQTSVKGMGKELVIGVIAAFVVAGTIGLVLAIMSKASKSS